MKTLFLKLETKANEEKMHHEAIVKLADEMENLHNSVSELNLAVEGMKQFLVESTQKQNLNKEKNHDKR